MKPPIFWGGAGGGFTKKQENYLKKGAWRKRGGGFFVGRVDNPMHTMRASFIFSWHLVIIAVIETVLIQ